MASETIHLAWGYGTRALCHRKLTNPELTDSIFEVTCGRCHRIIEKVGPARIQAILDEPTPPRSAEMADTFADDMDGMDPLDMIAYLSTEHFRYEDAPDA